MPFYQPFAASPSPELAEQPAQFLDGTKIKALCECQCQKSFKALAKGTLATVVSSEWRTDSRDYKIMSIGDGVLYFGVPEDALTDQLRIEELKAFG